MPAKKESVVLIRLKGGDPNSYKKNIKEAGGQWNPHLRGWELPLNEAKRLGLTNRILKNFKTS